MTRALALLAVLAAPPAAAEPLVDRDNHYQLELAGGWAVQRSGEAPQLLTLSHRSGEARAVLTRTNYPNRAAWRRKRRGQYFDDVVAGLEKSTPGFALVRRRAGKLGRIPYLDVIYRRRHEQRPRVYTRFLFYRTFTLILGAASTRAGRRQAARLIRSLAPPK